MRMSRSAPPNISKLADEGVPELAALPDGISRWTGSELDRLRRLSNGSGAGAAEASLGRSLCRTIDILGGRSQRAQDINVVLSSVARLREDSTARLYLLTEQHRGVGILKMGVKKLFVTHPSTQALVEVDPLCILDFYVDERCQRRGYGQQLFVHMLEAEHITRPEVLAIDRPSNKLLAFMMKHYGLSAYTPQVNNFVVYHRFFDHTSVTERGRLIRLSSPRPPSTSSCAPHASPCARPCSLSQPSVDATDAAMAGCAKAKNLTPG